MWMPHFRYLARSQSRRHRQRQPVPSVLPNVCYRASTNSLMINNDLYGRSEVNDRLDAFGYSEVRDSYARHNPDIPGGHLPLAELPRLRQQDSKLRLKVRDDDLYQGSTLTGRIDRYGYSDLRGVAKRHAAAADDDVLGAVGGAHLSFEEPEKEEENLYAEIKDVSSEQTRGEDLPSSALCPNPGEAELTEPYVPVDRIKKRKKEHRKYRKAAVI
ncbi:uncharacterized protein LOC143291360 [Babylonia areolata]|uniref:uncharacterized protein LOC143291360 n=1 Tax=Babylonia areolata TaxID=304850 RepID=UPI003FD65235